MVGPDTGTPIPPTLAGYDALIVLGGSMDPDDDAGAPWLPTVRGLISEALRTCTPMLGVCLGAQLVGRTSGAVLRRMPGGPEIGVRQVSLLPAAADDPLFQGFDPDPRFAQWHWFETALPAGAVALARSAQCEVQAFRLGPCAWGVQFHPEVDDVALAQWATDDADLLRASGVDGLRVAAEAVAAAGDLDANRLRIMENFRGVVVRRLS